MTKKKENPVVMIPKDAFRVKLACARENTRYPLAHIKVKIGDRRGLATALDGRMIANIGWNKVASDPSGEGLVALSNWKCFEKDPEGCVTLLPETETWKHPDSVTYKEQPYKHTGEATAVVLNPDFLEKACRMIKGAGFNRMILIIPRCKQYTSAHNPVFVIGRDLENPYRKDGEVDNVTVAIIPAGTTDVLDKAPN